MVREMLMKDIDCRLRAHGNEIREQLNEMLDDLFLALLHVFMQFYVEVE